MHRFLTVFGVLLPFAASATPFLATSPYYHSEDNIEVCGEETDLPQESQRFICANWNADVREGVEQIKRQSSGFADFFTQQEDSHFFLDVHYGYSSQSQIRWCDGTPYDYWVHYYVIYEAERQDLSFGVCDGEQFSSSTINDGTITTVTWLDPIDPDMPVHCMAGPEKETVLYTRDPGPGDPICHDPYSCVVTEAARRWYENEDICSEETYFFDGTKGKDEGKL
ncbi:MAG: hypothetical protein HN348_25530 [Proteobacteria bacterium]|jgi:hypothetical protein|nr:hypothetical protein [Pseudomonadota bacterium]